MKKILLIFSLLISLAIIASIYVLILKQRYAMQKSTRFLMDTICTIKIPGGKSVLKIADKVLDRMEEVDRQCNALNPQSQIYKFNHYNVPITDPEIVNLVKIALQVSEESSGLYDITVFPLVEVWGFYTKKPALPEESQILQALEKVNYKNLVVRDGKVTKLKDYTMIDLGGIAKGYAVGEALKVLKDSGIKSALIDAGGDIYALGKLHGKPWKVGIRNPRGTDVIGVLDLTDMSAATSGDYERFFEQDGVRYHHILDPRDGYPAKKGLISVTILTPDCIMADVWSKPVFLSGKEKGLEYIKKKSDVEAILVTASEEVLCSDALKANTKVVKRGGK